MINKKDAKKKAKKELQTKIGTALTNFKTMKAGLTPKHAEDCKAENGECACPIKKDKYDGLYIYEVGKDKYYKRPK